MLNFLRQHKKSVLVLITSTGVLALTVVAVQIGPRLLGQAGQDVEPQKVRVSNLSENSFTVSFTTDKETSAFIAYGTSESLGNTASGKDGTLHHIQVKGLKPATTYFFEVGSGGKQYKNEGAPYRVQTAPIATLPPTPDEMFGKVIDASGQPVSGVLVYATVKDADNEGSAGSSSLLSAQTTASGTFTIDLGNARTLDLSSRFSYSRQEDELNIEAEAGQAGTVLVQIKTSQTQPLADITVSPAGARQDLRSEQLSQTQLENRETRTSEAAPAGEIEEALESTVSAQEIEEFQETVKPTVQLPPNKVVTPGQTIKGKAAPNTTLTITIRSEPRTAQVTTDGQGNWSYTLPPDLEPGSHTLIVAAPDGSSTSETVTVSGGVGDVATVSASPSGLPVAGVGWPTVISLLFGFALLGLGALTFKTAKSFS